MTHNLGKGIFKIMKDIVLYCKSYNRDVLRAKRLVDSIECFNKDKLDVYMSVPQEDRKLFENLIGTNRCVWISDEEIVSSNPALSWARIQEIDPGKAQQIVKSEFWRLHPCTGYLCIDSDSIFIRDFQRSDFMAADGVPYTTFHQGKELLQLASNLGKNKTVQNFRLENVRAKEIFGRNGPDYDFGPTPVMWASRVWQDLANKYLEPRGWSFMDAINHYPAELRWYGEALLAYESIPLHPIEPLFRVYHTDWQYFTQRKLGENIEKMRENYLGVVMQSNWEYEMDYGKPQKSALSRAARKLRRKISQLF